MRATTNGVPVLPRSKKAPPEAAKSKVAKFRLTMTVSLGVGIPLLSLAMSAISGTLLQAGMATGRQDYLWLALFSFGLMTAVLGVSLSHVAWAVENITGSDWKASWALAVALDLSLVLTELCHVYAEDLGLGVICWSVMGCVALASMALNCHAFMRTERTRC